MAVAGVGEPKHRRRGQQPRRSASSTAARAKRRRLSPSRSLTRSTAVIAAARWKAPCSQTTNRPSSPSAMPLAAFASARAVVTVPNCRSSRWIATSGRKLVKYSASSPATWTGPSWASH
jgi:hypothetical protein